MFNFELQKGTDPLKSRLDDTWKPRAKYHLALRANLRIFLLRSLIKMGPSGSAWWLPGAPAHSSFGAFLRNLPPRQLTSCELPVGTSDRSSPAPQVDCWYFGVSRVSPRPGYGHALLHLPPEQSGRCHESRLGSKQVTIVSSEFFPIVLSPSGFSSGCPHAHVGVILALNAMQ